MSKTETLPRDEFRKRIRKHGVANTELHSNRDDKLYVFCPEAGYGFPPHCYDGLDVRLVETIGMDGIDEEHRLYRDYADHVACFIFNE